MKYVSFYDAQGRVTGSVGYDEGQYAALVDRLDTHVEGNWYGQKVYVANGGVHPRPPNPAEFNGTRLTGLPANTIIYINNTPYACDDGYADLEFTHPGTYRIRVECWPHLDKEFTIENPA